MAPKKGHTGLRVAAILAGMLAIGTCMSGMGLISVELHWWHGANEISSVRNNTGLWATLWDNADGTGAHRCVPPGDTDANVIPNLALDAFDNEIESFTLQTDSTCRSGQPAAGHSAH